ncbi:maleylpyruvate isomerase family mycothiol-dependent enzyme [Streptomyces uncialis]|uniref:maleylpyruvate isomerase family mycothiol-dependent enzyme n=1 Tax=Streptomyces uncialis TaxID=1048205 RepID=UPI003802808F
MISSSDEQDLDVPAAGLGYVRHREEIVREIDRLRLVLASGADLTRQVPTCPDWSLDALVRHTGGAVRWATHLVRERAQENIPEETVPGAAGPAESTVEALDAWLAQTAVELADALGGAGPDTPVWTWGWERTAGFWARRMTHELVVHRADATLAAGLPYEVHPEVAADALDEWLEIVHFIQRSGQAERAPELSGSGRSLLLRATDAPDGLDAHWLITFEDDGFRWRRGSGSATVELSGPLTDVLLAFYRRRPLDDGRVTVTGDRALLDLWLDVATFG